MRSLTRTIATTVAALAAVGVLAGCTETSNTKASADKERASVGSTYDQLVANQPAETMGYSPTRATKNFWINTWDQPGKLSYVYLQAADGKLLGYYVLEGLPVSYCTSLVPNFDIDTNEYGRVLTPRPSVDGTYSSGSNCNAYYGKDATTGAYVEWTAGLGINTLLYDQPLPRFADAQPLGATRISDIPK